MAFIDDWRHGFYYNYSRSDALMRRGDILARAASHQRRHIDAYIGGIPVS